MNLDLFCRYGFRYEHIMICHDNAVSGIKSTLLGLKKIIRVIKMDALLPSLLCLLMALKLRVMRDKNS